MIFASKGRSSQHRFATKLPLFIVGSSLTLGSVGFASTPAQNLPEPSRVVLQTQFGQHSLVGPQSRGLSEAFVRQTARTADFGSIRRSSSILNDQAARQEVLAGVGRELQATPSLTAGQRRVLFLQAKEILDQNDGSASATGGAGSSSQTQAQSSSAASTTTGATATSTNQGVAPIFSTPTSVPLSALPSRIVDVRATFLGYPDWLALCAEAHPMGRSGTHWRQLGIQACISTVIFYSSLTVGSAYRFHLGNFRPAGSTMTHEFNLGPQVNFRWVFNGALGADLMGSFEYVLWFHPGTNGNQSPVMPIGFTANADLGLNLSGRYGWWGWWGDTGFWAIPIFRILAGVAFH